MIMIDATSDAAFVVNDQLRWDCAVYAFIYGTMDVSRFAINPASRISVFIEGTKPNQASRIWLWLSPSFDSLNHQNLLIRRIGDAWRDPLR